MYWILSQPQNWHVCRRASDFKWLSERLNREYTQLSIPRFEGSSRREVEAFIVHGPTLLGAWGMAARLRPGQGPSGD